MRNLKQQLFLRVTAWITCVLVASIATGQQSVAVSTTAELIDAVTNGQGATTVLVAPGIYELDAPLQPKQGMTITGADDASTIIRSSPAWIVGTAGLPDNAVDAPLPCHWLWASLSSLL
ncbi:MAG: hypothetical protein AAF085_08160 [Planctomycetota bacterium]